MSEWLDGFIDNIESHKNAGGIYLLVLLVLLFAAASLYVLINSQA